MKPVFVVYMGGTCGDVVTALVDWSDSEINHDLGTMVLNKHRQRLKKPNDFSSNQEKDIYVNEITQKYISIPSHDIEYHVNQHHEFIGIACDDSDLAHWAARRFKQAHRPHVWQEVEKAAAISSVEQYAELILNYSAMIKQRTNKIIMLEDIVSGQAMLELSALVPDVDIMINEKQYQKWLSCL